MKLLVFSHLSLGLHDYITVLIEMCGDTDVSGFLLFLGLSCMSTVVCISARWHSCRLP
jgi:hypothetical protein